MTFFKPKYWDKNQISFFSILFLPISLIYKIFSLLKYFFTKAHEFSIPIICVGNIYVGGTGKTPLCNELFLILRKLNKKPAFVRKKYESFQDESRLQKKIGPLYEKKRRADAIKEAIQNKVEVVILDDGFQDFSIKKNFSIVCFTEDQWIGNGLLIPSGPMRENLSALKRANCVVINGKNNSAIEEKILRINNKIKIFYTKYEGEKMEKYRNKKVMAFAGIGNPDNFFNLLKMNNVNIIKEVKFPDHYNYSKKELENLVNEAKRNNTILLTTEKDYLRINDDFKQIINYIKIVIKMEKRDEFIDEIKKIL